MKLRKKIYPTQEANKLIDRSFIEFGDKIKGGSLTNFFEMYNKMFLNIPKTGTFSHTTLYNRSGDYINNPQISSDRKISQLNKKIIELEAQIVNLQTNEEILKTEIVLKDAKIVNFEQNI